MAAESRFSIYAAIAANLAIAVTKFSAAVVTGSSAMFSEGIHSVVDTGNGLLLLLGLRLSNRAPNVEHPFGHGKELYFWTLIVAVGIFAVGGGISTYEGILHLLHPRLPENPKWNYIVLACAAVFESISLIIALREFRKNHGAQSFWQALRTTKDPTTLTVILEDSAALAGLAIAFIGVVVGHRYSNVYADGIASTVIGVMLAGVAVLIAAECRGLIVGEGADPRMLAKIRQLACADPAVDDVGDPLTMYFGPHTILLALDVQFGRELSTGDLTAAIERIESAIRQAFPDIRRIFIEAESIKAVGRDH